MPSFDAERAFADLERQVAFGHRVPGTEAHALTRDWLAASLRELTPNVGISEFTGVFAGSEAVMYNIVASFQPEKTERILLCAHWDSRPFADKDPDPANHTSPVPGANDGASGVAVLLEIARAITAVPPQMGVDIALFDGEDGGAYGDDSTWLLGSRHFAASMPASYRPSYAVLLDMIGDRDLELSRDVNSMYAAPAVWKRAMTAAAACSIDVSTREIGVTDDHIPLIERGIPAIDLIDFDYPYWHTIADTPDKCSAGSLGKIGRLVLMMLYGP